jgi:hypothetical protein
MAVTNLNHLTGHDPPKDSIVSSANWTRSIGFMRVIKSRLTCFRFTYSGDGPGTLDTEAIGPFAKTNRS